MGSQFISLVAGFFESGSGWAALVVVVLLFVAWRKQGVQRFQFRCDIRWEGERDKSSDHNNKEG